MTVLPVPGDAWAYSNGDDEIIDAEGAEEEAVHVRSTIDALEVLDEVSGDLPVIDEEEEEPALAFYDDEDGPSEEEDADRELDLQQILEAQHYAFEPESQEGSV